MSETTARTRTSPSARGVGPRPGSVPTCSVMTERRSCTTCSALDPALRRDATTASGRSSTTQTGRHRSASSRVGQGSRRTNDRAARLSRTGIYRLAFGLTRPTFARLFGAVPRRPPKGRPVALPGYDLTQLDALTPHPVYAWMSWVQILSPTPTRVASLEPLLAESLQLARERWRRRVEGAASGRRSGLGAAKRLECVRAVVRVVEQHGTDNREHGDHGQGRGGELHGGSVIPTGCHQAPPAASVGSGQRLSIPSSTPCSAKPVRATRRTSRSSAGMPSVSSSACRSISSACRRRRWLRRRARGSRVRARARCLLARVE